MKIHPMKITCFALFSGSFSIWNSMFQYNLASEFSMTSFITITIIIKGDDVIGHVTLLTNAILLTVTKLFCY